MTHVTVHGGKDGRLAPSGSVSAQRAAAISALCLVAGGVILGAVHHLAGNHDSPESRLASVAFGLPLFTAGLVALLGTRSARPELWVAAGAAACPIAALSVIGLPVVIPAIVLIVLGVTRAARWSWAEAVVAVGIAVALAGVFAMLVFHHDPATWTTPTGGGSSSDIITGAEIAVTVAVGIATLAAAAATGGRSRTGPASAVHEAPPTELG